MTRKAELKKIIQNSLKEIKDIEKEELATSILSFEPEYYKHKRNYAVSVPYMVYTKSLCIDNKGLTHVMTFYKDSNENILNMTLNEIDCCLGALIKITKEEYDKALTKFKKEIGEINA